MTRPIWHLVFVCPRCGAPLARVAGDLACPACRELFPQRDGIERLLPRERLAELQPFLEQYRRVRDRDGYRSAGSSDCRRLPHVESGHPQAASWRLRRSSYATFRRQVLARFEEPSLAALDLGAGNGWLSFRLARLGHQPVAVDILDDDIDGLGAHRRYDVPFVCVQADFDRLPFAAAQFDLVIFNGSLHYSPDPPATLARVWRLLAPDGALVVMDSPLFRTEGDGRRMVKGRDDRFRHDYGLDATVAHGVGYLAAPMLASAARSLRLTSRFFPSRGSPVWEARRLMSRIKLGRQPARFGVWVAR